MLEKKKGLKSMIKILLQKAERQGITSKLKRERNNNKIFETDCRLKHKS